VSFFAGNCTDELMGVSAFGCRRSGKAATDEHGSTRINHERGGRAGAGEEMVRGMRELREWLTLEVTVNGGVNGNGCQEL
jgi:hypothetical protein